MDRTKSIIIAGTLTGLVLITFLAFGFKGLNPFSTPDNASALAQPTSDTLSQIQESSANAEALQSWQQYSHELEQAVQVLQQREANYQAQIEMANQTIMQLQEQLNAVNAGQQMNTNPRLFFGEREEHETFDHD